MNYARSSDLTIITFFFLDDVWKTKEMEIINECQSLLQDNNTS